MHILFHKHRWVECSRQFRQFYILHSLRDNQGLVRGDRGLKYSKILLSYQQVKRPKLQIYTKKKALKKRSLDLFYFPRHRARDEWERKMEKGVDKQLEGKEKWGEIGEIDG